MIKKSVLFVCYGGGHAAMVIPVINELKNIPQVELTVFGLTTAGTLLRRHHIPYLGFKDFVLPSDEEALKLGEEISEKMHGLHTDIPEAESRAYLGLSYCDLEKKNGKEKTSALFSKLGRQSFCPTTILERVFDRVRPDLVVTTNSPRAEEAARLVANERDIPVLVITDLFGHHYKPLKVKHLCVANTIALDRYKKNELISADNYHVVGNPAMDRAQTFAGPADLEKRRHLFPGLLGAEKYVIVSENQGYYRNPDELFIPWSTDEILKHLDRVYVACRNANVVILVRPHPSVPPEIYVEWSRKKEPKTVYVANKIEINELISMCDLLIGNTSTVLLDALYLNKPVLVLHFPGAISYLNFDEMGMAFSATIDGSSEELSLSVANALTNDEMKSKMSLSFKEKFPSLPCAPRIVNIILKELQVG